ncbi:hypothetical protein [Streptomyces malaysiensis]
MRGRAHLEQEVLAAVGRADCAEQAVAAARGVRGAGCGVRGAAA